MPIPEKILSELNFVAEINDGNEDWMVVKKQILYSVPSPLRTLFSTRHPKTKLQSLNEFECELIKVFEEKTGTLLRIISKEEREHESN